MVYFFFQAEDGIRDYKVTGVQTCTLPISRREELIAKSKLVGVTGGLAFLASLISQFLRCKILVDPPDGFILRPNLRPCRSEERRVGKEWRERWAEGQGAKKQGG